MRSNINRLSLIRIRFNITGGGDILSVKSILVATYIGVL